MTNWLSNLIDLDRPLGDAIERGRDNNFDLLRLTAALSVLFGHSFVLTAGHESLDPGKVGDFSYGVYLYAFPVQQALVQLLPPGLNGWWLSLWASIVTLSFAAISWFLVEQRALKKKGYMARTMAKYRR